MKPDPVRWEAGEQIYRQNAALPGAFVMVYAVVLGWKHLQRLLSRLAGMHRR